MKFSIYIKQIKKADGSTFPTYYTKSTSPTMKVVFTQDADNPPKKPFIIDINKNDFFFAVEEYTDKYGNIKSSPKLIITGEFRLIEAIDIKSEHESKHKADIEKYYKGYNETNDDLPF